MHIAPNITFKIKNIFQTRITKILPFPVANFLTGKKLLPKKVAEMKTAI